MEPHEALSYGVQVATMIADPRTHVLALWGLYMIGHQAWLGRRLSRLEARLGLVAPPKRLPRIRS